MKNFLSRRLRHIPIIRCTDSKYNELKSQMEGFATRIASLGRNEAIARHTETRKRQDIKFTEPRVLAAVRDLCEAGATVFDVGANIGGITVAMSRAVGPRGVVCGFEANLDIVARCQVNVNESGCGNTQLYDAAIYRRSRETIPLYLSDNNVADSICYQVSDRTIQVPTLALDDFVAQTKLIPQFVKMDIEGAELDALEGFGQTIKSAKPVMILEQIRSDNRCLAFLKAHGYAAFDLSTYTALEDVTDLPVETVVTDILYALPEKLNSTPYRPGTTEIATLIAKDFIRDDLMLKSAPFVLERGRYIVHAHFEGAAADKQEMFCGVMEVDGPIMRHHGHSDTLSAMAHRWVFDTVGNDVAIFFQFVRQYPESFRISFVRILQVDAFRGRSPLFV